MSSMNNSGEARVFKVTGSYPNLRFELPSNASDTTRRSERSQVKTPKGAELIMQAAIKEEAKIYGKWRQAVVDLNYRRSAHKESGVVISYTQAKSIFDTVRRLEMSYQDVYAKVQESQAPAAEIEIVDLENTRLQRGRHNNVALA